MKATLSAIIYDDESSYGERLCDAVHTVINGERDTRYGYMAEPIIDVLKGDNVLDLKEATQ